MKSNTNKKTKVGVIVSDDMDKTVVVEITRTVMEPVFKKYIRRKKKFMAHDEKNECHIGDRVEIMECRPFSKNKHWRITNIIERQKLPEAVEA